MEKYCHIINNTILLYNRRKILKMKIGDKVICIYKTNNENISLTIGKEYIIQELIDSYGIRIINDNNSNGLYHISRFADIKIYRKLKLKKLNK